LLQTRYELFLQLSILDLLNSNEDLLGSLSLVELFDSCVGSFLFKLALEVKEVGEDLAVRGLGRMSGGLGKRLLVLLKGSDVVKTEHCLDLEGVSLFLDRVVAELKLALLSFPHVLFHLSTDLFRTLGHSELDPSFQSLFLLQHLRLLEELLQRLQLGLP
jgi:hypothetical protein